MKENENKIMESFYHYISENHINHVVEEFDRISADALEVAYPSTLDVWFDDYNEQLKKQDQKRKFRSRVQLLSKRVAIFFAIALVGIFVTTMSVEAFRIKLFNIVTEVTEKYTKVSIVETENSLESQIDWESYYLPEYITERFTYSKSENFGDIKIVFYSDAKGKEIQFSQTPVNPEYQIDTEDAVVTDVTVNGEKGILIEKEGLLTLIWTTDEKTFHIIGEIEKDEIMKMAKSLKYFSK
ncbi:DUF4367 domain-containing protein [Acetoanaerobium sticklandii]|uniref:DUF4367 domain-containing protein n=1 Tax=Acetoanaerobium sticklandii TaxID=1511 RepID=UPI003A8EB774